MICKKCGNKLEEISKFCNICGEEIIKNSFEEDKVLLELKPNTNIIFLLSGKFGYWFSKTIIIMFFIMAINILITFVKYNKNFGTFIKINTVTWQNREKNLFQITFWIIVISFIVLAIRTLIYVMQLKKVKYEFYKTKVIFKDTFLNLEQKDISYKHIKEIEMKQNIWERFFNIGDIIIYTNAENEVRNGLAIENIEDPKKIYSKICNIINIKRTEV